MGEVFRAYLEDYSKKYKDVFKFKREHNILEVRVHTDEGPMKWGPYHQQGFMNLPNEINNDPENEIVIFTGTGDSYSSEMLEGSDPRSFVGVAGSPLRDGFQTYDLWYHVQTREPMAILDIRIPVIAAINGPVMAHAEIPLTSDIVICSDNTTFRDEHTNVNVPPTDGCQTLWRELLGHNRSRYFLYMNQKIDAQEALQLGIVSEVLPKEKVLPRAWEIAEEMMRKMSRYNRRLTRGLLVRPWRVLFANEIENGLAHEGWSAVMDTLDDITKKGTQG